MFKPRRLAGIIFALCLCVTFAGCLSERQAGPPMEGEPTPAAHPPPPLKEPPRRQEEEFLREETPSQNKPENSEEDAATVMNTDFSQFADLPDGLVEWGSGGPTDADGRPDGATLFQGRYGKYDAYFIMPDDKIYLTFDEGYEQGFTPVILDTLKEKGVKAAFFITMHFAKDQPELVRRMIDEGHILANHSTRHRSYPSMPIAEAAADLMELHDYVKETFDYEMTFFRYPEGKFSEQTLAMIQSLGYKSFFWSFAYVDYNINDQPLTITALDKITTRAHPGALYLLHAVSQTNSEILGEAIDLIRGRGFEFSTWETLPPAFSA